MVDLQGTRGTRPMAEQGSIHGFGRSAMYRSLRLAPAIVRAMATMTPTLTPMPDGFYWAPRCHLDTLPTGLFLHGELVASLIDRIGGTWFALLHLEEGPFAPDVRRDCTSFEKGRWGAEMWALRHEQELQARAARKLKWVREEGIAARIVRRQELPPSRVTPN